jgi:4-amino-4-deoxy-L-arabinose transferase-like glycosyltransferase
LLLVPFVSVLGWWQSGVSGALPAMFSYVAAVVAVYRLAKFWLPEAWSVLAAVAFAANPSLLYLQATAMTEPLSLALFCWSLVWTVDCSRALDAGEDSRAAAAMVKTGAVLAAAVLTRYDGWILTALIGCYLLVAHGRRVVRGSPRLRVAAIIFSALVLAAPLAWLWFNARYFHDPLDFARGPYSAKAIEARTSIPGHVPHPGYHQPWIAFRYYLRVSTLDAAAGAFGNFALLILGFVGLAAMLRRDSALRFVALTLWFPLAFYTYSVGYGSVPIFMPVWPPHAYYNTRYGLEMLPAFAVCASAALFAISRGRAKQKVWITVGWALAAINAVALAAATPVVLQEARANSATRIPFEHALSTQIAQVPADKRLLMYASAFAGALQEAGRPLRDVTSESDYYQWRDAMQAPAANSDYVLAVDGDPVARAVALHPEGLSVMNTITSEGQPRAVMYRSIGNT